MLSSFANLDHLPIYAELDLTPPTPDAEPALTTIWDYQKMDIALLTRLLLNTDWTSILNKDTDAATSEFIATLHDAAAASIPKIHLKRKRNDKF